MLGTRVLGTRVLGRSRCAGAVQEPSALAGGVEHGISTVPAHLCPPARAPAGPFPPPFTSVNVCDRFAAAWRAHELL